MGTKRRSRRFRQRSRKAAVGDARRSKFEPRHLEEPHSGRTQHGALPQAHGRNLASGNRTVGDIPSTKRLAVTPKASFGTFTGRALGRREISIRLERLDEAIFAEVTDVPGAKKNSKRVKGPVRTPALRSSDVREVHVNLRRLEDSAPISTTMRTSTPRKRTAERRASSLGDRTKRPDFFLSKTSSDECELEMKRFKLCRTEHDSPPPVTKAGMTRPIKTAKSKAVRVRQDGASFTPTGSEDVLSSGSSSASEGDASSYRSSSEVETDSTESSGDWEESISDGTPSASTYSSKRSSRRTSTESSCDWEKSFSDNTPSVSPDSSNRSSRRTSTESGGDWEKPIPDRTSSASSGSRSRASAKVKQNLKERRSGGRELQRLGLKRTGRQLGNVQVKASQHTQFKRPAREKQLSDSCDDIEHLQERDTSRTFRKAVPKEKLRAMERQVARSQRTKNKTKRLKTRKERSSSWKQSNSTRSNEGGKSLTSLSDTGTRLRSSKQSSLTSIREKRYSQVGTTKAITTRREPMPQHSSGGSDMDSEPPPKEYVAQLSEGPIPAKQDNVSGKDTQHAMKRSEPFGSQKKRKNTGSTCSSEEWLPTRPIDSKPFQSVARNVEIGRRKSLRARGEGMHSSQDSSSSVEPRHLRKNAKPQSDKAFIRGKQQVNRSRTQLTRRSTKALLSEEESESHNSYED